eukprot:CAMPEP_0113388812 /NCGR_PEP_ID=MMETSP0013_2-20120614/9282_1 /TAXON_ID=2843 ORGANISM="Skeletonema costatum, Strain 1716" /NCGR_SAMPLE_ID=MMETSP0013_2 /ASSEMBLY_ACC=CAM_ASM_000158 /LENGTH=299 /DNA_ID=CAMNT_0000271825 /DNA_START=215 /DNA_END=1114 /DNA_ORIENTATION=+ /assembly_acc=CAM_ASM_000158
MNQHCATLQSSAIGAVCCKASVSSPVECERKQLSPCRRNQNTRRRSHRRRGSNSSSRQFLFALCSIFISAACLLKQSQAFSSSSSSIHQSRISNAPSGFSLNGPTQQRHRANTRFYMSSVLEPASQSSSTRMSDFQRRMKGIVKRNGVANGRKVVGTSRSAPERPANLKVAHTLEEYKDQLDESSGKIVVVRFFATWCKACKAIQPSFYRMAALYPHITFVEVPVTNHNANLHQGLEVPSLPYGHIYYPDAGLVEEMKISKKYFPGLVKKVRWYDSGLCGLDEFVPEDSDDDAAAEKEN